MSANMTTEEKQIDLMAKLYQRRRDYKSLVSAENYAKVTADMRRIIALKLEENGGNHISTAMAIIKEVPGTENQPMVVAAILSAALDMAEGK